MGAMEKNMRDFRCFAVTLFDQHNYESEVTQTSPTHYTTGHVIGALSGSALPIFRFTTYSGLTIIPDPRMRKARVGRPRGVRIRTNMDDVDQIG
ncbi:hypothetical protein PIB30_016380 [Stylosanthes scabra]|uniref:Uncharacterized protein n=1 Tax=Stylosanthes scabra TaxID=79078 RepID=A0ABU6T9C7_9FABA|nr:hypothetical protein [Stylosanthes scabra]